MNLPRFTSARWPKIAAIGLALIALGGCQSQARSAKAKPRRPAPPVQSATAILHEQAVSKRARELINEGKYTTSAEARRAAQREIGEASDTSASAWSTEYARYEKQVKEQEKFEADLAKLKRGD